MKLRTLNHRQSLPLAKSLFLDPFYADDESGTRPFRGSLFYRTRYYVPRKVWTQITELDYLDPYDSEVPVEVDELLKAIESGRPPSKIAEWLESIECPLNVDLENYAVWWAEGTVSNIPNLGTISKIQVVAILQEKDTSFQFPDFYFIRYLDYPYRADDIFGYPIFGTSESPGRPPTYDPNKNHVWDAIDSWPSLKRRFYVATSMAPAGVPIFMNLRTPRTEYGTLAFDIKKNLGALIEPSRVKHVGPSFLDITKTLDRNAARTKRKGNRRVRSQFRPTTAELNLISQYPLITEEDILSMRVDSNYVPAFQRAENEAREREQEQLRLSRLSVAQREEERRRAARERAATMSDEDYPSTEIEE